MSSYVTGCQDSDRSIRARLYNSRRRDGRSFNVSSKNLDRRAGHLLAKM